MRTLSRNKSSLLGLFLALALAIAVAPGQVAAHERRALANGKYEVVVGFLTEPAYDHQLNGLDFTVVDKTQQGADGKDKPVEGLEKTLKAEVLVGGGKKLDLTMRSRFGLPGKYAAYFEPTRPGPYTFHVYGDIEGAKIDERFDSGPGRFNDVESLSALQFPDREGVAPADLQAQLDAAQSRANRAQVLGIAGLVVGLLGLGAAGLALRRRPAAPAGAPVVTRASQGD